MLFAEPLPTYTLSKALHITLTNQTRTHFMQKHLGPNALMAIKLNPELVNPRLSIISLNTYIN